MQENKDHFADPSQVSVSGQGDSPSVFLHSSKLRNKLEKLAQWRIDPSLIEFPPDVREFSGGFAKVSRGVLASPSQAKGGTNKSEHITGEHLSSEAGNIQPEKDSQEPGDNHRAKDEGADGQTADGDNDHNNGERTNDNGDERKSRDKISMLKTKDAPGPSESIVDEDPDLDDHNLQPQRDTQEPDDDQKGKDGGTNSQIADDGNGQTKEKTRNDSDNSNEEQYSSHQTSQPKIVAVKKFKIETDADVERVLGSALRESEFLIELSHSNIIRLEGFVEDLSAQKVWLIFPWEEYGNLRQFLAAEELEIPERISLINDVTVGLEYLHSQEPPVYHGDLKSLNILVNSECRALITDFGSARHLGEDHVGTRSKDKSQPAADLIADEQQITLEALFSATASTLTLAGSSYTLRWAAPELLQDDGPCLRSDIWSLGWIAYEVMTNTIPFHDIKADAIIINRVIQGHLPSVTEDARMSLIRALCSVMVLCWSINPDKRPTAEECRKFMSWMPMIVPAPTQAKDEEASQLHHASLLNQLGQMYRRQSDYVSALNCFTEALDIYTKHSNSKGRADSLYNIGDVHRFRGNHADAVRFYSEALEISTTMGNEKDRADALWGLAEAHRLQRKYGEAAKLHSESLAISTSIGSKRDRATALWGLAEVHRDQGEYSEATGLYSEALQIYTDIGDRRERALTLGSLARMHRVQHNYSEAINLFMEALQIYTDVGDHNEKATTLWGLAEVHRMQQQYSEAIKLYSEALQIFIDVGDNSWRADTLMSLAETYQIQGHFTEAISLYTEASKAFEESGIPWRASGALEKAEDIRRTLQAATTNSAETLEVGESSLPASG